jgi:iron complex transport system substrate-binding protein
LLKSNTHYQKFTAFKKDQIFTFANTTGDSGGVLYFELAPTRPDLVLKDIIKITHPELLKDYSPAFFKKMK